MEEVTDKYYYHIQTKQEWKLSWKVGDEYEVGSKINPFFSYYDTYARSIIVGNQNYHVNDVSREWLNQFKTGKNFFGDELNIKPEAMIEMLHYTLEYYLRYTREVIFEEVRFSINPELPSRQKGLWLVAENSIESINYWKEQLGSDHTIFLVKATGKVHRGSSAPLLIRTAAMGSIKEIAREYWNGVTVHKSDDELLFEGSLKVIDVLQ